MAAEHVEKRFPDASDGIEYIYLKIDDSPTEDIKRYFETVIDFIVKPLIDTLIVDITFNSTCYIKSFAFCCLQLIKALA